MANFKIEYRSTQTANTITETFDTKEEMITRWGALIYYANRAYITDSYQLVDGVWQPC